MVLHCTIVGFGAQAVSRKTPIYFMLSLALLTNLATRWRNLHCYIAWDYPISSVRGCSHIMSANFGGFQTTLCHLLVYHPPPFVILHQYLPDSPLLIRFYEKHFLTWQHMEWHKESGPIDWIPCSHGSDKKQMIKLTRRSSLRSSPPWRHRHTDPSGCYTWAPVQYHNWWSGQFKIDQERKFQIDLWFHHLDFDLPAGCEHWLLESCTQPPRHCLHHHHRHQIYYIIIYVTANMDNQLV